MSEKYFIQKETLDGIADVIREATGSNEPISFETTSIKATLKTTIENSGVKLPTLDNPAVADDILEGKESIDGSGNIITGTIPTKTTDDLTASGATVTVPSGYYASQATKSVSTATQATPTISVDSAGKITASSTQSAGYVSSGTKTATQQLTVQAAKTITPSTNSQTAVAKDRYTTGVVTVEAIPNDYMVGDEITAQNGLISQIQTALQGKAVSGGGYNTIYINTSTPSNDVGVDGDIWVVKEVTA
jgi:hypothetical protein